jgi:hypothetical protein
MRMASLDQPVPQYCSLPKIPAVSWIQNAASGYFSIVVTASNTLQKRTCSVPFGRSQSRCSFRFGQFDFHRPDGWCTIGVRRHSGPGIPRGKGRPNTWVSVGPSQALYPLTPFRSSVSYVPNDYDAGGRTTSIAIADTCVPGDCRIYVTPAGGGVWTTKNALNGQPHWVYLGGPLGINAAGAVTIDPNDPSGNTIYVGTGEANICGSGCVAGVGLYKSVDGGATWNGPLGKNELGGKGLAAIVVMPALMPAACGARTMEVRLGRRSSRRSTRPLSRRVRRLPLPHCQRQDALVCSRGEHRHPVFAPFPE